MCQEISGYFKYVRFIDHIFLFHPLYFSDRHAATVQKNSELRVCAQFGLYPDNHKMPKSFDSGGMTFRSVNATFSSFINVSGANQGLQFHDDGLTILFSSPPVRIALAIGAYATDVQLTAENMSGTLVSSQSIAGNNTVHSLSLVDASVAKLSLTGGGNEGLLVEICTYYKICE